MSQQPDLDPAPPPEPEHPTLVEELRHEVEEIGQRVEHAVEQAVEHVPKPVRWTVRKLILLSALVLFGLVVLAIVSTLLYFANRTELVAHELTLVLNGALAQRSDVQIEIGDIQGNPLQRVRLLKPRVRFMSGDSPALLEAPWIDIRYSPTQWMRRDRRILDVVIESPTIRLARGADGKIRLPEWRTSGKPGKGTGALDVNLKIRNGGVFLPAPYGMVRDMALDGSASIGKGTSARIRSLTWAEGPFETRHLQLAGRVDGGDEVHLRIERLRTDDLAARAHVTWHAGQPTRRVEAVLDRVSWRWLARATKNKTFDVPGEGRATVQGTGSKAWNGTFRANVNWNGLDAEGGGGVRWSDGQLALKPLHVDSKAGTLDGDVAWSKAGWSVGGEVRDGNPELWKAIGIPGWPQGDLAGTFRYAVDTRRAPITSGAVVARLDASQLAGWNVDAGTVTIDMPAVGPDSFRVDAQRRGGTFALRARTDAEGWNGVYRAANLPLEEWPDGRASGIRGMLARGEGTVAGRAGRLDVTGTLGGTEVTWLGMHAARWALDDLAGRLLPTPDLRSRARLEDVMFLGIHLDSVRTPFALGDRTVALEDVRAKGGDTLIAVQGNADWDTHGWSVVLDRARMTSSQFDWTADPPLRLAGDPRGVTFERFVARDRDAIVHANGRWAAPGGTYDWTARAERLDLARLGLPTELRLAGRADATLRVTGANGDPRWSLDGEASRPGWQGHFGDSLVLALSGRRNTLDLRRGWFRMGGGIAEAHGAFEGTAEPWPDTLTAGGVSVWLQSASRWNGTLDVKDFALDEVRQVAPGTRDWSGRLDGTLTVGGRPEEPTLDATFRAHPLNWRAIAIETLRGRARYARGQLEVPELKMTRDGRESSASGHMALRLGMGKRPEAPEEPMAWRFDVPNGDLSIVRYFVPQIGLAGGGFELHADVAGTPKHPDLSGGLQIKDGVVRMVGREELFQGVQASVRLDESRISIDTLTARQGTRGRVTGSGVVDLAGGALKSYRFDFAARELTVTEPGLYAALFDGRFAVVDGPRVRGQRLPFVSGEALVRQAVISYDFANLSENEQVAATAAPLYWTYRIHVTAERNVRWQPPDGDIEFAINLNVEQRPDELVIYGDMNAIRGTYYFLSNRFNVTRVDLTFDNVSGVNPQIDAEAVTRLPDPAEPKSDIDVTVRIHGRAREPLIELTSSNGELDQATLLRQLTVERFVSNPRGIPLGDPLDNYITRAINRTFSAEMTRAFRGYLNEWEIDRERGGLFSGEGGVILGVGSQLTPRLSLRYRQRLPGADRTSTDAGSTEFNPLERNIEAEYRLSRFIYLTTELTQRRGTTTTTSPVPPEFNVNLKARWEY